MGVLGVSSRVGVLGVACLVGVLGVSCYVLGVLNQLSGKYNRPYRKSMFNTDVEKKPAAARGERAATGYRLKAG